MAVVIASIVWGRYFSSLYEGITKEQFTLNCSETKIQNSYLLNFLARRFAPKESPDTHPSRRAVGRPPY